MFFQAVLCFKVQRARLDLYIFQAVSGFKVSSTRSDLCIFQDVLGFKVSSARSDLCSFQVFGALKCGVRGRIYVISKLFLL